MQRGGALFLKGAEKTVEFFNIKKPNKMLFQFFPLLRGLPLWVLPAAAPLPTFSAKISFTPSSMAVLVR